VSPPRMNGELKKRVVAIIEGEKATVGEKLDLVLGLTLDTHERVHDHETRLLDLERYPQVGRIAIRAILGLGALAGALAAIYGLYHLLVT